ncbi:NAD-dependent deacetylase [Naumannella halotolerans]|uniref:SIR2 family NAD-dependent protein deacylase n=1 Tax=Naumannella halotolerans TaxID=993414 RepID=UPI00370DBB74
MSSEPATTDLPEPIEVPEPIAELVRSASTVGVLTGAGMSAESGVPTFRDAQTGLWARYDPMTLATPEAFAEQPDLVWAWYAWRLRLMQEVAPNAGHLALARWGRRVPVGIATQNVDDLHERAGSIDVAHLHGTLFDLRCFDCGRPYHGTVKIPTEQVERLEPPHCQVCFGPVRPGIVWFGEMLPAEAFERAQALAVGVDLLLVVGTSGLVQPAAGIPLLAKTSGVPTIELNPDETPFSDHADQVWRTTAAVGLPAMAALLDDDRD